MGDYKLAGEPGACDDNTYEKGKNCILKVTQQNPVLLCALKINEGCAACVASAAASWCYS